MLGDWCSVIGGKVDLGWRRLCDVDGAKVCILKNYCMM